MPETARETRLPEAAKAPKKNAFRSTIRVRPVFQSTSFGSLVFFKGPGDATDVSFDRETGLIAVMNDLHKSRNSGAGWSWVINASAATMLVSLSGFGLLFYIRHPGCSRVESNERHYVTSFQLARTSKPPSAMPFEVSRIRAQANFFRQSDWRAMLCRPQNSVVRSGLLKRLQGDNNFVIVTDCPQAVVEELAWRGAFEFRQLALAATFRRGFAGGEAGAFRPREPSGIGPPKPRRRLKPELLEDP